MKTSARHSGFTLLELLVVIAIIGILAAIAMPTLSRFRAGDTLAAGVRQLQDDVARARQFAISQRTTVYMVFCPSNFWADPGYGPVNIAPDPTEKRKGEKLYGKQLNSYAFVTLRSVGEQPGRTSPRYLSSWQTMSEGVVIPLYKFWPPLVSYTRITDNSVTPQKDYDVYAFDVTNNIPFPSADAPPLIVAGNDTWAKLPFIAFNHLGQAIRYNFVNGQWEVVPEILIPVARGNVSYPRVNGVATNSSDITMTESPPGNSTNAFLIVRIDGLTGRARVQKQEFK